MSRCHGNDYLCCSYGSESANGITQVNLFGERAFDADEDCKQCKNNILRKSGTLVSEYKKRHHPRCQKNQATRGLSGSAVAAIKETAKLSRFFAEPLTEEEKCTGRPSQEEIDAYFKKRLTTTTTKKRYTAATATPPSVVDLLVISSAVCLQYLEPMALKLQPKGAPLGILALAKYVEDNLLKLGGPALQRMGLLNEDMAITAPFCEHGCLDPIYHSIVGQELLIVDWEWLDPEFRVQCPWCASFMRKNRSNFSHNKLLFPLFDLQGPTSWAIVQTYKCPTCNNRTWDANDGELMCKMPPHLASKYPVETKYARGNSHIKRGATRVMQQLMVTYGNGDLFSRLLFDNLKELHVDATENYYSYCESYEQAHPNDDKFEPGEYPEVYGEWITKFPPLGGTIRKLYDDGCNSKWNHYEMADGNRRKRELMSETCEKMFVYDHTHAVS